MIQRRRGGATKPNHAVQPTPCAVGISNDVVAALAHAAADGER
jgi:hypothetical protein